MPWNYALPIQPLEQRLKLRSVNGGDAIGYARMSGVRDKAPIRCSRTNDCNVQAEQKYTVLGLIFTAVAVCVFPP